jgi:hypothetical protein
LMQLLRFDDRREGVGLIDRHLTPSRSVGASWIFAWGLAVRRCVLPHQDQLARSRRPVYLTVANDPLADVRP